MSSGRNAALLWSVEVCQRQCYLFGTMHTRHASPFGFLNAIEPLIRSSKLYCAELNLGQFDAELFGKSILLPPGNTLKDLLGITIYHKCARIFEKSYGIQLDQWVDKHPFMLLASMTDQVLTPTFDRPFDHHLWDLAGTWGKDRGGLESFSDQMTIMRRIPLQSQVRALKNLARNPQRLRNTIRKLLAHYEQQDIQQLYLSTRRGLTDMRRLMLDDRNLRMVDRLVELAAESSVFAAVGAAHLAGSKGMLRLLKQRGARLKPIPLQL